jgi:hypothetical protein
MDAREAAIRLEHTLAKGPDGRYCFACKKAFVMLKLVGRAHRVRFGARDQVAFRADPVCLTVERRDNGAVKQRFTWEQIECLAVGEPEVDNGPLFQG